MAKKKSQKTFLQKRWTFLLAILYVLSPIDLIPDVIAPFGSIDDTAVLIVELLRQYNEYKRNNPEKD